MDLHYNRILIFDGSHALHRSLSEPHLWEMRNKEGYRTGGIYGVLQTILKECTTFNYFPVVIFDGHLSERRLQLHPNYKHFQEKQLLLENNEQLTEEQELELEHRREYNTQREALKQLLPALGIPVIHLQEWEGDDIIYILSKMCKDSVVVSDDKDLLQLICHNEDRRCSVRRGMRDEFWDLDKLKENNIDVREFICCKAIVGDNSDNIPSSCFQVGEKTAPTLYKLYTESLKLGKFPTDDKELENLCKSSNIPKRKAFLNFNEDQFLINLALMDLNLVENDIDEGVIYNINNIIETEAKVFNIDLAQQILNNTNIVTFNINNLLDKVTKNYEYLDISSFEKSLAIKPMNEKRMGTLF